MGYPVTCTADSCDFEGFHGNHRGQRLADTRCPKCGGKLRRPGVPGARKRQRCVACGRLTEAVTPSNLGPILIAKQPRFQMIPEQLVTESVPVCRSHHLILEDGRDTCRVEPERVESGVAFETYGSQMANRELFAHQARATL